MPQASHELHELVKFVCNSSEDVTEREPTQFLVSRGYNLTNKSEWELPSKDHFVSENEELCLRFLVDEWDYGWIVEAKT